MQPSSSIHRSPAPATASLSQAQRRAERRAHQPLPANGLPDPADVAPAVPAGGSPAHSREWRHADSWNLAAGIACIWLGKRLGEEVLKVFLDPQADNPLWVMFAPSLGAIAGTGVAFLLNARRLRGPAGDEHGQGANTGHRTQAPPTHEVTPPAPARKGRDAKAQIQTIHVQHLRNAEPKA